MPTEVKEVMKHMNKYTWESTEVEKEGIARGQQQWNETQIQIATALQASWTGAVNKGLNDKKLREITLTTSNRFKHSSHTNDLLVKLTIIRWKHAKERIDLHEAYYCGWTNERKQCGQKTRSASNT